MPHRARDKMQPALIRLNTVHDMSWAKISQKVGIPAATLWDVAHGKPVPRKWRRRVSRDLYAMPVAELLWALLNREEM